MSARGRKVDKLLPCRYGEKRLSIEELEKLAQFSYVHLLAFPSEDAKKETIQRHVSESEPFFLTNEEREKVLSGFFIPSELRWINEAVGFGLFADCDVKAGEYIGEYAGVVRENDTRHDTLANEYCYAYPAIDPLGREYVIDAKRGNLARFMNHSYTPTLFPRTLMVDGVYHVLFFALKDLERGGQLCYNYGPAYWYTRGVPQTFHDTI